MSNVRFPRQEVLLAKPGRNEPCHCGSGSKYKNCHLALDEASPIDRLRVEQDSYLRKWRVNATSFEQQGCYAWMAEQATKHKPKLLLDIGCGEGRGIKAILGTSNAHELRVVAIDENMACLKAARDLLVASGVQVSLIDRTETSIREDGKHSYIHRPIQASHQSQVTLIQSDLLTDRELVPYLSSIGPFDAVTVWLTGTHFERRNCMDIASLSVRNSGEYRLRVQNKAYRVADSILGSGGVLHLVDRGEVPDTEGLRNDFLNAHRDQASVTSLRVLSLEHMQYHYCPVKRGSSRRFTSIGAA